jgi:hypothetical protein
MINKLFDFDGKEIRVIEQDNDFWMIVADLTKAWDLHRNTLNDIISRNEWKFAGNYTTVAHDSCAGMIAVNEVGMYLLMGAVHINLVKNEKAKTTIVKFNKEWPRLVKAYRKGEVVAEPQSKQGVLDTINHQLDLADIAIKRSDVPKEVAHSMAWALAATITKAEINGYATFIKAQQKQQQLLLPENLLQDKEDYDRYFSLTQISGFLKLPTDKVRNVLESLNLIYYENGIWHLTKQGEKYGKVFMIIPSYPYRMNQKAYIKYNPLALDILKKYFDVEIPVTKVKE